MSKDQQAMIRRTASYVNENTWLILEGGPAMVKRRVVETDGKITLTVQDANGKETNLMVLPDVLLSICEWPDPLTYAVALAIAEHCPNVGRQESDQAYLRAIASEDDRADQPASFMIRYLAEAAFRSVDWEKLPVVLRQLVSIEDQA